MRTIFLFVTIATLLIAGCTNAAKQNTEKSANDKPATEAAQKSEPVKADSEQAKPADQPASDLKPDNIDLEKPFDATDLRNAVAANLAAWEGKVVTAIGISDGHTVSTLKSGDKFTSIKVKNEKSEIVLDCAGPKTPPTDMLSRNKDRIFKGPVKKILSPYNQVVLEPCEVIN